MSRTRQVTIATVLALSFASNAPAALVWFDETNGGTGYVSFAGMASGYQGFMGAPSGSISLDDLGLGTHLADQYSGQSVRFQQSAGGRYDGYSGVWAEGGSIVEDLTGYDGLYRPNGNSVYVKFDNESTATPFTITFDSPVASVGAFLGMGVQGAVHTLQISIFDADHNALGDKIVQSWLWETATPQQNYETFFAVSSSTPSIGRVEIRNLATTDFANALIIDDVSWQSAATAGVPEPGAQMLWVGYLGMVAMRRNPGTSR